MEQVSASHPQAAFLDHVFGVVDSETAAAIADSDFLPHFGRFEVATVDADGESWRGRYLFGRRTYLELFGPDDLRMTDTPGATAGVGLSTRNQGGLGLIAERMTASGKRQRTGRKTLGDDNDQVPWFDYLEPAESSAEFEVWVMEFLQEPSDLQMRDAAFAQWMARPVEPGSPPRGPVVSDLSLVQLAASVESIAATEPMLRASGFETISTPSVLIGQDAETTVELHATTEAPALRRVVFGLSASPDAEHVERIGGSCLTVGPTSRAVWDFSNS